MYEVELKVRADHGTVRDRLDELGAERDRRLFQEDTYYNAPDRDFAETDEALRIRRVRPDGVGDEEATARVTYKGPLLEAESKSREEFETGVDDGDVMRELLARLGFEPAATVRKLREKHELDGFTVLLDAVEDVGEYVEVETEVDGEAAVEAAREDAYELLRSLGLDPGDQVRTSYLGLQLEDA